MNNRLLRMLDTHRNKPKLPDEIAPWHSSNLTIVLKYGAIQSCSAASSEQTYRVSVPVSTRQMEIVHKYLFETCNDFIKKQLTVAIGEMVK